MTTHLAHLSRYPCLPEDLLLVTVEDHIERAYQDAAKKIQHYRELAQTAPGYAFPTPRAFASRGIDFSTQNRVSLFVLATATLAGGAAVVLHVYHLPLDFGVADWRHGDALSFDWRMLLLHLTAFFHNCAAASCLGSFTVF